MTAHDLLKKYQGESIYLHEDDVLAFADEYTEPLMKLQSELKDTLFVRPYDIEAIESAAIKLCDAIIELKI